MINIGIIEDEDTAAARLTDLIELFGREKNHAFAVSRFKAAEEYYARIGRFDILFLDIELPGANGMDMARKIRERDPDVIIVFVTNLSRMAVDGYSVGALNYIIKPVGKTVLFSTMTSALREIERRRDIKISVNSQDGEVFLSASEIAYVEVFGHKLVYHVGGKEICEWDALSKLVNMLSPYGFIRCGKSLLINLRYLTSIKGDEVTVAGDILKVGRGGCKAVLEAFNRYMNG